jgi:chorismate mutase
VEGTNGTRATACRGVRGATTVAGDDPREVELAVAELLDAIVEGNGCRPDDVAALTFTLTEELADANPAAAARAHGWAGVPLLMVREHGGDPRVPRCIRVLLLWNTTRTQQEIRHAYLRDAAVLRPDLAVERTLP